jgi:hypothetical protein
VRRLTPAGFEVPIFGVASFMYVAILSVPSRAGDSCRGLLGMHCLNKRPDGGTSLWPRAGRLLASAARGRRAATAIWSQAATSVFSARHAWR